MPPHHKRGGTRHQSYLLAASFIWEKVCNYSSSQPFLVGKKKKKIASKGRRGCGDFRIAGGFYYYSCSKRTEAVEENRSRGDCDLLPALTYIQVKYNTILVYMYVTYA